MNKELTWKIKITGISLVALIMLCVNALQVPNGARSARAYDRLLSLTLIFTLFLYKMPVFLHLFDFLC